LGSPSIITEAVAGCVLLEKELDVVGLSGKLDKQSTWTLGDRG